MTGRQCSECGKDIGHRDVKAKTCGDTCRQKRARRQSDERKMNGVENHPSFSQLARADVADVVRDATREVVAPVVREAIDDSILKAVRELVGLTPDAVAAVQEDLRSDDARIRQNAYQLIFKYTVGHPVVGPKDDDAHEKVVINLGLPRPGTSQPEPSVANPWDVDISADPDSDVRPCDTCGEDRHGFEFVGLSSRCNSCFNKQQEAATALLEKAGG